jgi:hypothetical protein
MYKLKRFGSFQSNNGIENKLMTSTQYNPVRILERLKCRKLQQSENYGKKKTWKGMITYMNITMESK